MHPKDKLDKLETAGIVYAIGCAAADGNSCPAEYVGESERTPSERGKEHFSTAKQPTGVFKSAIMQHAADHNHHFRLEDFSILAREPNYHARGIREAYHIRALSPTINREDARHSLPHNYDTIIRANSKKPPRPRTHQPDEPRLHTIPRGRGRPPSQPATSTTGGARPRTAAAATAAAAAAAATAVPATSTATATTTTAEFEVPAPRAQREATHNMTTRRRIAQLQGDRGTAV